ncbi:phospholipase A2 inhibitor and Ly6/PLAUR domain-containing protein-like [Ascaphus truei]|uniref:phospholipase A2 inhibitor and Ly6/PLAUR domain-containing protein-like n=1 Tax=Ascaphus truei TaxID=8439 RepID=UPI003F59C26A
MRSLLQVLCVLSALVGTGYSLSCAVCVNMSGTSCTGPSMTCPAADVCISSYTVNTTRGTQSDFFARSCAPKNKCVMSGSISLPEVKIKLANSCCTSDNCTPSMPTLPADNNVKNGLTCPTCASANSDNCHTPDTIECTGDEEWCLLRTTKISGSISSLRGCATESICSIGRESASFGNISTAMNTSCTDGSVGLHPGFSFPAAVALMLINLLH